VYERNNSASIRRTYRLTIFLSLLCALASAFVTARASAQIDRPGAHPHYAAELEPHGLIEWDVEPSNHVGFGLGLRCSIPLIQNGPVQTINNSLAIGFGLDWAHSSHFRRSNVNYDNGADNLGFPVVVQWNFFFSDVVSLLVELGLEIRYENWDRGDGTHDDDVEPFPQFLIGPRFLVGKSVAIPIRIGYPYLSVGVSFLL
jgi:hypothetical protein